MSDKFILDEHGEPVRCDDLLTWAKWFESADRTVAHDLLARDGDGGAIVRVSTVFLGLDHSFGYAGDRLPLLWETIIFGGKHDGHTDRYSSRGAALKGHAKALELAIRDLPQ